MDRPALLETLKALCGLPHEAATVEFKSNLAQPDEIGQYLSALANAAALDGHSRAWLVWGVEDGSHAVLGTTFDPLARKATQKLNKMRNPLQAMRRGGLIERSGPKAAPIWKLGTGAGFATDHAPSKA